MTSDNRVVITVRVRPELKAVLERAVEEAGMEVGTASRQILELFALRLQAGTDYLDAIGLLKNALRNPDPRTRK